MRLIVLGVCLFAAACSGQALNSPTSPTNASLGPAQTAARGGTALPFSGSYTSVIEVPPPSATGLSRVQRPTSADSPGLLQLRSTGNTATGKFTFIAANGDQLSGTFVVKVSSCHQIPPRGPKVATIENGTGRFAGATGTFTMVTVDTIDFANGGKATGYGSFEGRINLNE